jgi:hypothetical protein
MCPSWPVFSMVAAVILWFFCFTSCMVCLGVRWHYATVVAICDQSVQDVAALKPRWQWFNPPTHIPDQCCLHNHLASKSSNLPMHV